MLADFFVSFIFYSSIDPEISDSPILSKILLSSLAVIITWIYVILQWPLLFQTSFILIVFMISYKRFANYALIKKRVPGDRGQLSLLLTALTLYVSASCCWLIDYHYCDVLNEARLNSVLVFGPFLATVFVNPLLQLHSWWHILMSLATYIETLQCVYARLLLGKGGKVRLIYSAFFIPQIETCKSL